MELDELKKMKETVESAARDVESSIHGGVSDFEKQLAGRDQHQRPYGACRACLRFLPRIPHPKKKWRIKQGATPQWYKARNGVRTKALSGAARVARYRPHKFN